MLSQWDDRPRDVKFILDSLDVIEQEVDGLSGRIDRERVGVAGHSFGAHTTMMLSGLQLRHPRLEHVENFHDERIDAAIAISPQGPGQSITRDSYTQMVGPMLMITGDHDGTPIKGREDKAGAWRRKAFEYAPAGDMYLLWIDGAHHGFGGINGEMNWPGAGPIAPDHVLFVKSTTLALFDAFLRDDDDAKAYLNSDQLAKETDGKATLTAKQKEHASDN